MASLDRELDYLEAINRREMYEDGYAARQSLGQEPYSRDVIARINQTFGADIVSAARRARVEAKTARALELDARYAREEAAAKPARKQEAA